MSFSSLFFALFEPKQNKNDRLLLTPTHLSHGKDICTHSLVPSSNLSPIYQYNNCDTDPKDEKQILPGCVIAQMGQLERVCGDNGVYTCFAEKVHELYNRSHYDPICDCGAGFMGNKCNGVNNDKVKWDIVHQTISRREMNQLTAVVLSNYYP